MDTHNARSRQLRDGDEISTKKSLVDKRIQNAATSTAQFVETS